MKLGYAAVLAFAGWYLLLVSNPDNNPGMSSEPWSSIQHSFNTAKECEEARAKAVYPPAAANAPKEGEKLMFYCVSSDDPRLAK